MRAAGVLAVRMVRGALWGALIGVGIGAIGRTIMRAVAIAGGLEPTWSAGFSLHLLIVIATVNAAIGMSYAAIRDVVPGGRRRGLVGGLLVLLCGGYPGLLVEFHAVVADIGWAAAAGGVTALSTLFLLDGVWLEAALRPREHSDADVLAALGPVDLPVASPAPSVPADAVRNAATLP